MVKSRKIGIVLFLVVSCLGVGLRNPAVLADDTAILGTPAPDPFNGLMEKKISVNVKDLDPQNFFSLLSGEAGVPISVSSEVTTKLSYAGMDLPVSQVLDEITSQNGLQYVIQNGTILVSTKDGTAGGGAELVRRIPLKFANCTELLAKIMPLLPKGNKIMADETTNSLVFMGSPESYDKVVQLAGLFDSDPKQIMIQGLVVEATETFLQSIGFSYNFGSTMLTNLSPTGPNLTLTAATIAGHNLNLNLAAAESRGDAKVISRPKLVTLNNKAASLNSGLSLYVKTLSTTQSAQPGQIPVAVTGGLAEINAGLTVNITPTIVGENRIRLKLSVTSSSPDNSSTVDGIPGVDTDSATTTVIVQDDRTAIIAGLIKRTKSVNHDGVPFLMDIPVLGALFRSDNRSDDDDELAIFITPSILKALTEQAFYPNNVPQSDDLVNSVGDRHPSRAVTQVLVSPVDSPLDPPPAQK